MGWIHSALLFSAVLGGSPQEPLFYDDYTPAYHAAQRARLPLIVIFNPGGEPERVCLEMNELTRAGHRRNLLQKYVVASIDTSTARGKVALGLFRPPTLPSVVVIDREQKYQLFRSVKPRQPEEWNLVLEHFQQGDLATLKSPPVVGLPPDRMLALNSQDVWCRDFAHAQAQAKRLRRPVLLHFFASWCGPCQRMEREVLNSPPLLQTLHHGFVAVKVNVDDQPQLVKQFKIESLPSDVFVTPQGAILSQNHGYLPASGYLSKLVKVAKEHADLPEEAVQN